MSQTTHTPTPWHTSDDHSITAGPDPRVGMTIARLVNVSQDANAAFIVRAVNAHDALVAALGTLLDQVDYTAGACSLTEMVGGCLPKDVITSARAALKLARGEA